MPLRARAANFFLALCLSKGVVGCDELPPLSREDEAALSKVDRSELSRGQRIPNTGEAQAVGAASERIRRGTTSFSKLVSCRDCPFVFKNEEKNHSDRMMTPRLQGCLLRLSRLVKRTWPEVSLRVTEAWDDDREHGKASVHYEGRAADITTSDQDPAKLGRLAALAVAAGFDWVYYEDSTHVHVSVRK